MASRNRKGPPRARPKGGRGTVSGASSAGRGSGRSPVKIRRKFARALRRRERETGRVMRDSEQERLDKLYASLSQASKDYLDAYSSDFSYREVKKAGRRVPEKDRYAVSVLLEGIRPAFEYAAQEYGYD